MFGNKKDLHERVEQLEKYMVKMAGLIQGNARLMTVNAESITEVSGLVMQLAEQNNELHDIVEEHIGEK